MKKNVGLADTIVRVILAIAVAALYLTGSVHGKPAIVLGILAAILLITGVIGFCPLYALLGISTKTQAQSVSKE
jgi:Protein of unknown function (DUF2892)